jgi:hypothetical protein
VTDLNKVLVISAIMGALLIAGLLMTPTQPAPVATAEPAATEPITEVTILPQESLEMLDPIYSEKAVFYDDTVRIAFNASFSESGVESRLPFWIHNLSDGVISVLWDRCSIQLPNGNTMKVINEESLTYGRASDTIVIAPKGDLFDAVIPVSELSSTDDAWSVTTGVFDQGTFTFVLAIEVADCPATPTPQACMEAQPDCPEPPPAPAQQMMCKTSSCGETQIAYYTFRFVIR